jgi:hypothetical protein
MGDFLSFDLLCIFLPGGERGRRKYIAHFSFDLFGDFCCKEFKEEGGKGEDTLLISPLISLVDCVFAKR